MRQVYVVPTKIKFALIITMVLWASAFVGIRAGLQGYTPGVLALLRFSIASVCMLIVYLRLPARDKIIPLDACWLLMIGALTLGIYHAALNYGELSVTSGIASFIISQSPVITTILAVLFLGERLNRFGLVGMVVSIFGMTLIMLGQNHEFKMEIGNFYILLAAFMGSVYSVLQKPFLKKYHVIEVTAYLIWGGTLALLFYVPTVMHEISHAPISATLATIYLGIFPAGVAYVLWGYILAEIPVSRATNFMYAIPVIATFLGWFCLGEIPMIFSLLGGMIALLGVWIVNKSYHRKIKEVIQ